MRKKLVLTGMVAAMALLTAACGGAKDSAVTPAVANPSAAATVAPTAAATSAATAQATTITYLDKSYELKGPANQFVITGSMESMEDALLLGVEPVGGISVGGKFPAMFESITKKTTSIGEKTEPNFETILKLKPTVILSTTKFPAETGEKLSKITTTIPVSHIATNWDANLRLMGELTGKKDEAEKVLKQYQADVDAAKAKLGGSLKDKKVVVIRIRQGSINIYPANVFFNPSLYTDLGLAVPDAVKAAKAQEVISLEKFSEINPDYIFVQFSEDENKDQPKALDTLQSNPIWTSIEAVKANRVFVNVVDSLAQGGTAWSKINFLKAATEKLSK